MDEKKWMDEIKRSAEQIEVPDSLSPEAIRKKLDEQAQAKQQELNGQMQAKRQEPGGQIQAEQEPDEQAQAKQQELNGQMQAKQRESDEQIQAKQESDGQIQAEQQEPDGQGKTVPAERFAGKYRMWRRYGVRAAEIAAAAFVIFVAGYQIGFHGQPTAPVQMAQLEQKTGAPETVEETAAETKPAPETTVEETAAETKPAPETAAEATTVETKPAPETAAEETTGETKPAAETAAEETTAETKSAPETAAGEAADKPARVEGIAPIGSEEALYERLAAYWKESNSYLMRDGMAQMEIMPIAGAAGGTAVAETEAELAQEDAFAVEEDGADAGAAAQGDFSQTNLRELGVDEGDIVKTDGEFIYILKQNSSVEVIRADGSEMERVCSLTPELLNESVRDLYVSGELLNIVTGGSRSSMTEEETDVYTTQTYDYAKVLTYDISEPGKPRLLGSMEQEGYYLSSRKAGDYIYLFTEYHPEIAETREESGIMPLVNGVPLDAGSIYVPETLESTSYLVIGSVNIRRPGEEVSHKAVVSGADHFYVSRESIFICSQSWQDDGDVTDILKFAYEDGEIWGVGVCRVQGYLNDTFSLDEYDGYLRVVATNWNQNGETNALYIYDKDMELTGRIDDIAPGESVRSARFLGDTGYFVTFRQTDPLFSVDLSDPQNPRILGALKVSGFSSYLHFYGKDRLLGIGYEADAETGATTGIKLSMFDVTDPADVKEIRRYVIKGADYCPGLSNYKAIMINPEKNLFGFVCDDTYLVFAYDEENGFINLLTYNLSEGARQENYWYAFDDTRGLYIADTFYLAETGALRAFDMKNGFEQATKLDF